MADDLSKIRRYELKYAITESVAGEIREYIRNVCVPDKHVETGKNYYIVNNIYFDTDDLRFYYDTKYRKLTRFKARARYYGLKSSGNIWPEIKFKHANIVWKVRKKISTREWADQFSPEVFEYLLNDVRPSVNTFEDVVYWFDARPISHVRYVREPYVSVQDDYGRITFDRELCYRRMDGSIDLDYNESEMLYYDDPMTTFNPRSLVLLEIKTETLVPYWVIQMIKMFGLAQRPFSKYCYSIDNMLERNSTERCSVFDF
ncbi:MAG: polyphosphate polymerase domain-containing protein [Candidatus Marinimicrobia bacterium]|nr:polyphosphate polymerase domain-containing protein [Candidatus Neomarinimicrobiota bacterium]